MGGGADDERMVDLLGRKQGWEIGRRRQPELRYPMFEICTPNVTKRLL